jgi:uncharacterized protein (TIGR00730 family)
MSTEVDFNDPAILAKINDLIAVCGGDPQSFQGELITEMVQNSLKMARNGYNLGQIKLMTKALKEMRYAFHIFNKYASMRTVSIFGSARTPEGHPDYRAAEEFSAKISALHWMCMTGAADGIMKAGLAGATRESSFGLSIRLPFEAPTNILIKDDPKLINFRYFFTRKLMFVSHSDAMAVFPGGFGTLDELFEVLTLMQTGKSPIIPLVLVQGEGSQYWQQWEDYVERFLLGQGMISPEDRRLYYIAPSVDGAIGNILQFYRRYHSSRYVGDQFVIRLTSELTDGQVLLLNEKFASMLMQGQIVKTAPFPDEDDHLDLPRIAFYHNRRNFSLLRLMIDQINAF